MKINIIFIFVLGSLFAQDQEQACFLVHKRAIAQLFTCLEKRQFSNDLGDFRITKVNLTSWELSREQTINIILEVTTIFKRKLGPPDNQEEFNAKVNLQLYHEYIKSKAKENIEKAVFQICTSNAVIYLGTVKKSRVKRLERLEEYFRNFSFRVEVPFALSTQYLSLKLPKPHLKFFSQGIALICRSEKKVINEAELVWHHLEKSNSSWGLFCNVSFLQAVLNKYLKVYLKKAQINLQHDVEISKFIVDGDSFTLDTKVDFTIESERYFPEAGKITAKIFPKLTFSYEKQQKNRSFIVESISNLDLIEIKQKSEKEHNHNTIELWRKGIAGLFHLTALYLHHRPIDLPISYFESRIKSRYNNDVKMNLQQDHLFVSQEKKIFGIRGNVKLER